MRLKLRTVELGVTECERWHVITLDRLNLLKC